MTHISEYKARLLEKLNQMNQRLQQVEDALDKPLPKDWEDAALDREDDEVLEELGHTAKRERSMIVAALERIVAGEYGVCVKCAKPIPEARLDALPYTPVCAKCAS